MERICVKRLDEFTVKELYEVLRVRAEVFVVQQNCVYQDLDGKDERSLHVIGYENGKVAAYLRIFWKDASQNLVQIGRVLTMERGKGFGADILKAGIRAAKENMKAGKIFIEAQCYATGFYEKAGFRVCSQEFLEDGIPHVEMILDLK